MGGPRKDHWRLAGQVTLLSSTSVPSPSIWQVTGSVHGWRSHQFPLSLDYGWRGVTTQQGFLRDTAFQTFKLARGLMSIQANFATYSVAIHAK